MDSSTFNVYLVKIIQSEKNWTDEAARLKVVYTYLINFKTFFS